MCLVGWYHTSWHCSNPTLALHSKDYCCMAYKKKEMMGHSQFSLELVQHYVLFGQKLPEVHCHKHNQGTVELSVQQAGRTSLPQTLQEQGIWMLNSWPPCRLPVGHCSIQPSPLNSSLGLCLYDDAFLSSPSNPAKSVCIKLCTLKKPLWFHLSTFSFPNCI